MKLKYVGFWVLVNVKTIKECFILDYDLSIISLETKLKQSKRIHLFPSEELEIPEASGLSLPFQYQLLHVL